MRIFDNLRVPARIPQKEPVPIKRSLPMKLKLRVSGKGERNSEVACLQELTIMLDCFKNNEFKQEICSKEINNLQKCFKNYMTEEQAKKNREQNAIVTPDEKNLSAKQLNNFLKKFPPN
ncbi:hypothetical protein L9F63_020032 [Diploptera punctata]|uniref:Coiled-coil-helix-coiled-coil-helix domain-containing protein 1 n=1 Tax=Diploptera punctata TaxID=6984 RepID=A0AAD7ZT04_DIPPU|nr:hypothetical protein L9F63_020032 [Diploptera punctata]